MPITIKQNSITFQDENGNSNNSSAFLLGSTAALEQRLDTIEYQTIAPAHSIANKAYAVGDYVMYNDNLYKCKTAHTSTSWVANNWTKVSMVEDYNSELTDLKSALKLQGLDNLLDNLTHLSTTHNNIMWTWNGNSCNVVGTASGIENNDLFSSPSSMPSGFEAGKTYYIRYSSSNINLRIYYYPNGGSATELFSSKSDGEVLIPNNAVGLIIRLNVPSGAVVNETITPLISKSKTKTPFLYRPIFTLDVGLFEKGGILNGQDVEYAKAGRIRTQILYALNDIEIEADIAIYPNARIGTQIINTDGKFVSDLGWKTEYTINAGTIFRLVLTFDYTNVTTEKTIADIIACFDFIGVINTSSRVLTLASLNQLETLFEHGGLENGVNNAYNENARARTISILTCKKDIFVKYNSGIYGIHYFKNGVFTKATPWIDYGRVIPANTEFRLVVTPQETSSVYTEITTILNGIELRIVDSYEYGLNPNILYQARNVDDSEFPPYSKWYIQASALNQYDRVRVNIRKTTDGHYVLIHDNTINSEARNPDGTTISETINSNGQTLSTLNSYDWGIKYGEKYAGYGVPTLEEACEYASMYNLGLTIEVSFWATDEEIDEMAEIINKYSLLQNLIVIAVDSHIWGFSHWVSINDYISVQAAGDIEYLTEHESEINSYKTDKNTVYVGVLPWPSVADDAVRALAFKNSWKLYCGMVMNKNDLFNTVGFDKGYSIIEANNLYRIKDTIRDYANATLI